MAQRTGAERFLASAAKTASAGLCLALAAAAIAGCGSSSDEENDAKATTGAAASTAQGAPSAAAPAGAAGDAGAGVQGKDTVPGGDVSSAAGTAEGKGQKHGPRIAQPKGAPEQAPTPAQINSATVADMSLQSPAITASGEGPGALPATYTCEGKDSWPAFAWGGVPAGSAELILYAMNVAPVEGKLFVDWAVAGLDPSLSAIEAAELPRGAVVGTNSFGQVGYEICPPPGGGEIYMFAIYALPQKLSPKRGFDARELRKEILDVSGNVGLLPAVYARG